MDHSLPSVHSAALSSTRCLFLLVFAPLPGRLDLRDCRRRWLGKCFANRLQWAPGPNARSMDMVAFLVKTSGFLGIYRFAESRGISADMYVGTVMWGALAGVVEAWSGWSSSIACCSRSLAGPTMRTAFY